MQKDGIYLLDKPIGWTSHDLVDALRRGLGVRRIGHAGTLDPLATGLMILLVGKQTSKSQEFMGLDKTYCGSFRIGIQTDSWDMDGRVLFEKSTEGVLLPQIENFFSSFGGHVCLKPPTFSAIRLNGKKAYSLARNQKAVSLQPRESFISSFKLFGFSNPEIYFEVSCSKGTYVRSIANHIGEILGTGAVLSSLVRTRIGPYFLKDAKKLYEIL